MLSLLSAFLVTFGGSVPLIPILSRAADSAGKCVVAGQSPFKGPVPMDNGDGSQCLTIDHSVRLSERDFEHEIRVKFVCTRLGCPEFECRNCTFRGVLRFSSSVLQEDEGRSTWDPRTRGLIDLTDSSVAVLQLDNSIFGSAVSIQRAKINWITGDGCEFRGPLNARDLHASAVDLPRSSFQGLVTLAGAQIDSTVNLTDSVFRDELDANGLKAGAAVDLSGSHFPAAATPAKPHDHPDCSCGGLKCTDDPKNLWRLGRATDENLCQAIEFANVRAEELALDGATVDRSLAVALSTFSNQLSLRNLTFSSTLDLSRTSTHTLDVQGLQARTEPGSRSIRVR